MQNPKVYHERIRRFLDRLSKEIYPEKTALKVRFIHDPINVIPHSDLVHASWKDIKVKEKWANTWACAWFIFEGEVPAEYLNKEVGVYIDVQGEACVFKNSDADSPNLFDLKQPLTPYAGLTNKIDWSLQSGKFYLPLFKCSTGKEKVSLLAEAGANGLFGKDKDEYLLERADIVVFDAEKYQLMMDIKVLLSMYEELEVNTPRKKRILFALNEICNAYQEGKGLVQCREIAKKVLALPAVPSALNAWSIGHAHIDLAWLWPVRETKRKASRTFSTVMRMMEEYPEYKFGASQAQLYQWTKENYPHLYAEIKSKIQEGRWEVQGATWVENDTNMPSGESLVRQCVYGKRFYREEFGKEIDFLFLPDCFGFTGSFPQILRQAGVKFFLSQKLSWNDTNPFPHHTFIWQGIDGSPVLTHFTPTNDYNFSNMPHDFIKTERRFHQSDISDDFLNMYGIGDGGGGPSKEHIELALRQQNCEGVPKVNFAFAHDFIEQIDQIDKDLLPVWKGELYFELHRGTYTTQSLMKKYNRKLECRLQQLEFIHAFINEGRNPEIHAEIEKIWKDTLLNQFHDIIPGSSITWVYEDAHALSEKNLQKIDALESQLIYRHYQKGDNALLLINTQSWRRRELVELKADKKLKAFDEHHKELPSFWQNNKMQILLEMPAFSFKIIHLEEQISNDNGESVQTPEQCFTLENNYLKIDFDDQGCISSIFDKEVKRQCLNTQANLIQMWEDLPNNWGAWDINHFYRETQAQQAVLKERKVIEDSPFIKIIEQLFAVGQSQIRQRVSLRCQSKMVLFENEVDWKETHKMLRVSADTNIQTMISQAEVQFGLVERPTHQNTSWDAAKFEILAHRFLDLSQSDYGFAVLNDCKYGHSVQEGRIEINLLRSPADVDPQADIRTHQFTYAYYPHIGSLEHSDTLQKAHNLNSPLCIYSVEAPEFDAVQQLCVCDNKNIKIDTIKQSDLDPNAYILRLYESMGSNANVTIHWNTSIKKICTCDLLEEHEVQIPFQEYIFSLAFKPFELKTIKIYRS